MKENRSAHLKVQEFCDCYATTDPLREMSVIKDDQDNEEAALKWLALSALHGINANAKKIKVSKSKDGTVRVEAEYRKTELPSPGSRVGETIFKKVREVTHIDEGRGKTLLSLGIRDSSIDLGIKIKDDKGQETVTIKFPD